MSKFCSLHRVSSLTQACVAPLTLSGHVICSERDSVCEKGTEHPHLGYGYHLRCNFYLDNSLFCLGLCLCHSMPMKQNMNILLKKKKEIL